MSNATKTINGENNCKKIMDYNEAVEASWRMQAKMRQSNNGGEGRPERDSGSSNEK